MKKLFVGAALAAVAAMANAELMNISANSVQTGTQAAVACTIIDDGTTLLSGGGIMLFVFAEGSGAGDPDLRVWSLDRDYVTTNNNWGDGVDISVNGQAGHINLRDVDPNGGLVYPTLLRAPRRANDAAAFILVNRGEKICAQSLDRSGTGSSQAVSMSITDLNAIAFKSLAVKTEEEQGKPTGTRGALIDRVVSNVQEQMGK